MEQQNYSVHKSRSSLFNITSNVMGALVFCIPAVFGWIPVIGYFAWIIPMYAFVMERKSNFVRFCASESLCICIVRLIFSVVFDGIYNVALRTVALYGQNAAFVNWWGNISAPGHTAHVISIVFAIIFTLLSFIAAALALFRKLFRIPVASSVADYMTKELRPISKHKNIKTESEGVTSEEHL